MRSEETNGVSVSIEWQLTGKRPHSQIKDTMNGARQVLENLEANKSEVKGI